MDIFIGSRKSILLRILFIFLCFFLTSTGYLAWLYHMIDMATEGIPELLAMGMGYFCQTVGIVIFSMMAQKRLDWISRKTFILTLALYHIGLLPSIFARDLIMTAVLGGLANVICGIIAGFYLYDLSRMESKHKALIFGIAYGLGSIASWILSSITNSTVYQGLNVVWICLALVLGIIFILFQFHFSEGSLVEQENTLSDRNMIMTACAVVFLFSIVNQVGFSFPSSDISGGVSLELSRLFYAAGLVIAGMIHDKNRKYGAIMTLAALMFPFIMLNLQKELVSSSILWALSYFVSGFFSIYRIVLFLDLAKQKNLWFLSGFGLLFGRLGESLGTVICSFTANHMILLVMIAGMLYAGSVILFFRLFQKTYITSVEDDQQLRFQQFVAKHDLSPREKEILSMLLAKDTTASMAEQLFVSASTVKFHIHNLLQKTGCKNRKELTELFYSNQK